MHRALRRTLAVGALGLAMALLPAAPSWADYIGSGYVDGDDIVASTGSTADPGKVSSAKPAPADEVCETKLVSTNEGLFIVDEYGKLHSYFDADHKEGDGNWFRKQCYVGRRQSFYSLFWVANVDPTDLARQALSQAQLPKPTIPISAELPKITLVNYPIWMWIDAGIWKPVTATATDGGLSVTVTAVPSQVVWDSGDSRASDAKRYLTCSGPGKVRPEGATPDQLESGSDCIYRYVHTSGKEKDLIFNLSATVRWHATWKATNGTAGDLGYVSTASAIPVEVGEWQAVNDYPEEGP